jgi:hypothetical protein
MLARTVCVRARLPDLEKQTGAKPWNSIDRVEKSSPHKQLQISPDVFAMLAQSLASSFLNPLPIRSYVTEATDPATKTRMYGTLGSFANELLESPTLIQHVSRN